MNADILTATPAAPAERAGKRIDVAKEYKVISLRDCPLPDAMPVCDEPERVAEYFRSAIVGNPYFDPERECLAVLLLNTRRKLKGHLLVSTGTLDTLLVHPREIFRGAIVAAAAAIIVAHNHPSGDPQPSEADIKITRDLIRAGQLLKIELLDHIVMGQPSAANPRGFCSLRELGFFWS